MLETDEATMAIDTECHDVKTFHKKFGLLEFDEPGLLTTRKLMERVHCKLEEITELCEGGTKFNLAKIADALIDLVYFSKGTAAMLGLTPEIWRALWDDVQRANMMKVRGVGHRGHAVDCIKPEGWIGPKTDEILAQFGYDPDHAIKNLRDDEERHT